MPDKIILGFTGQIASGKGTVAQYLKEKYNASTYRFSTMLRDILDRLHLVQNRENMQLISKILRENFGEDVMAKVMAEDVKNDQDQIIVIDGIRRPDDVKYLCEVPGFVLVHIFADMEKRLERIKARGENPDDNTKTLEEFKADHEREPEQKIAEVAKTAQEEIDNNGSFEDLYKQLDELIAKYEN